VPRKDRKKYFRNVKVLINNILFKVKEKSGPNEENY